MELFGDGATLYLAAEVVEMLLVGFPALRGLQRPFVEPTGKEPFVGKSRLRLPVGFCGNRQRPFGKRTFEKITVLIETVKKTIADQNI